MNLHWRISKDGVSMRHWNEALFYDPCLVPEIPFEPPLAKFMVKPSLEFPGLQTADGLLSICAFLGRFRLSQGRGTDAHLTIRSAVDEYLGTCMMDDVGFQPYPGALYAFISLGKYKWPLLCSAMVVDLIHMPFPEIRRKSSRSEMDLRDYLAMVVEGEVAPIDIDQSRFRPQEVDSDVGGGLAIRDREAFDDSRVYLGTRLGLGWISIPKWESGREEKRSMIFLG